VATRTHDLEVETLVGGGDGDLAPSVDEVAFEVSACPAFVETPFVRSIIDRALAYMGDGFPVHFRGPTGCGKTTLAIHLAEQLGRPMIIVSGDEEYLTSDLVGGEHGYERRRTFDNFIHSVVKTEDRVDYRWVDSRLTIACQEGYTLVYDEFNRSRPEANNIFLPVLEERILILPTVRSEKGHLRVHPNFAAVFTSNPKEYAGVHASQDALLDRMITLDLNHFDRDTEVAITQSRTGLPQGQVEVIVDLVRTLREATEGQCDPTVRACIMIGKVMAAQSKNGGGPSFEQVCLDVLAKEINPGGKPLDERRRILLELLQASRGARFGLGPSGSARRRGR
jgi:nitric oxide reductase NorQ protein